MSKEYTSAMRTGRREVQGTNDWMRKLAARRESASPSQRPPELPVTIDEGDFVIDEQDLDIADVVDIRESWGADELQKPALVKGFEIAGFNPALQIAATLEKKIGRAEGEPNEDNLISDATLGGDGFIAVADELGGAEKKGASKLLAEVLPGILREELAKAAALDANTLLQDLLAAELARYPLLEPEPTRKRLLGLISGDRKMAEKGWALFYGLALANDKIRPTKSTTTFCGGFLHQREDGTWWTVMANIGDSAGSKISPDGSVEEIFEEDSMLQLLVDTGVFDDDQVREMRENPEKIVKFRLTEAVAIALGFPRAVAQRLNVMEKYEEMSYRQMKSKMVRALGSDSATPALAYTKYEPGDKTMLETDGTKDLMQAKNSEETDIELVANAFTGDQPLTSQVDAYRELANKRGKEGAAVNKVSDDKAVALIGFPNTKIASAEAAAA